jgi:hypothetical protein
MIDIWSVVQWWDDWQLPVLALGSLGLQWFLLPTAPMRKYNVPHALRTCIWLAYISSDALAIYTLATLFIRHARTIPASNCAPGKEQLPMLEVLKMHRSVRVHFSFLNKRKKIHATMLSLELEQRR